jgi:3-deoxy-7-phosphoheptulonate synthase
MVWEFEKIAEHLPKLSILRRSWSGYSDLSKTFEVAVHGVPIGGPSPVVIAGPCAVESREHTMEIARAVRKLGVKLMRGGAFKPRTNPHDFQGLGLEGLKILSDVRKETGLGIVTEVMDTRMVEAVAEHADMFQVGTRSMYNYPLLKEIGKTKTPVLIKRAMCATLEEWLCAAEYVAMQGNTNIVLCERGIRTSAHWSYARCVLDLNVIEPLRRLTPLPVVVDPSHASGQWRFVPSLALAGLAAGAHGLLIEVVHSERERCDLRCDHEQGITPELLAGIVGSAASGRVPPLL